jgi:hypothetical protein
MIVIVYRGIAWVFIDPPFTTEATLGSTYANSLIDALIQAAKQARGDKKL